MYTIFLRVGLQTKVIAVYSTLLLRQWGGIHSWERPYMLVTNGDVVLEKEDPVEETECHDGEYSPATHSQTSAVDIHPHPHTLIDSTGDRENPPRR
jgi:hypothetical protein